MLKKIYNILVSTTTMAVLFVVFFGGYGCGYLYRKQVRHRNRPHLGV